MGASKEPDRGWGCGGVTDKLQLPKAISKDMHRLTDKHLRLGKTAYSCDSRLVKTF
jgi:hypothetical protein